LVGAEVGEAGAEVVEAWVGDEGDCGGGDASIEEVSLGEDVVESLGHIDGKLDATECTEEVVLIAATGVAGTGGTHGVQRGRQRA
jgi:hypothetical protein